MNTTKSSILVLTLLVSISALAQTEGVMRPVFLESLIPVESISPIAEDGFEGEGFLRKPPGDGRFPAVLLIHGGLERRPTDVIRGYATGTHLSRFLEQGYVIASITYRSRDQDRQSPVSISDSVAAVNYLKSLPYVDPESVVVNGCSGGGDLALEVAAATQVAAIAPEEPASMIFANVPRSAEGEERTNVERFRATGDYQRLRAKLARIDSPVLIIQGDEPSGVNTFNAEIFIPELEATGNAVQVNTYPGEPHCFSFYSHPSRTPNQAAALEAFEDIDTFFRQHIATQPERIESRFVEQMPIEEN